MKFILSDGDNLYLNLRKNQDRLEQILENNNYPDLADVVATFKDKMRAIKKNMSVIKAVAIENAQNSIAVINGVSTKKQELKDTNELDKVNVIELDVSWAYDEFVFKIDNEFLPNSCGSIEVVTKKVAEANDKELLQDSYYTDEDRANYKVGEGASQYSKLDDTYYFRFL